MKNLENISLMKLEYKELQEIDGGNGGYQAGIPGYGEQTMLLGAFLWGFFDGLING